MCTRYISPTAGDIERHWHIGARNPTAWVREVFPGYTGVFIRAARDSMAFERELVTGPWGLIPWFAKERKLKYPTINARSEELHLKASYKHPWARGQRCVVLAESFFEPCWESGKHVPWRFHRADGTPWALAGLFNTWADPATGELLESYTLLTINADAHPLMSRMHRPDPQRAPEMQDKRSVVPIEPEDINTWLAAPLEQAAALVRLAPVEVFVAAPAGAPPKTGMATTAAPAAAAAGPAPSASADSAPGTLPGPAAAGGQGSFSF